MRHISILQNSFNTFACLAIAAAFVGLPAASVSASSLPRPAYAPAPVLVYRLTPQSAGSNMGVTLWVKATGGPGGTLRVRAIASGGAAAEQAPLPALGSTTVPTWPVWLSKSIALDFDGWKRFHFGASDFTYRAPVGVSPDAPVPAFSTADAIGIETNRRIGAIQIDGLAWGGDDAGDNGTIIDDFSKNTHAWRRYGNASALAASALSIAEPGDGRDGGGGLKIDFRASEESTEHALSLLDTRITATRHPFVVLVPSSPLKKLTLDAVPDETDVSQHVSVVASPDQIQSASFAVYATTALTNVTVTQKVPLHTATSKLSASDIDINVVKVVKLHGSGPLHDPDTTTVVPHILVKDDRIALSQTTSTLTSIRLTGDPVTDIPVHTQKQFWLKISVPANAAPGEYTGVLEVTSDQEPTCPVDLSVKVLPLHLLSPSKQYAIGFRGKVGAPNGTSPSLTDYISPSQFTAELKDIAAHGFRYATLTDRGDDLWKAVDLYNSSGLGTPFLVTGFSAETDAEAIEDNKAKANGASFYYLPTNTDTMAADLASMKGRQMTTAAIVSDQETLDKLADNIDVVIYRADHPYVHDLLVNGGNRKSGKRDWLYWTSAQPEAATNRLYAGFLIWRANLYGAYASDYETSYGTDPFDDSLSAPGPTAPLRPQMLTYPVQGGVLDTVQWEAMREGVTDVRYLTTFYAALRECKDNHVAQDTVADASAAVTKFFTKPLSTLTDDEMQSGRLMIATYTLKLRSAVDAFYKKHPQN